MANKTIIELNPVTPSSTAAIPVYENGGTGRASASQILRTQDILYAVDDQEPTSAVSFESADTELTPASSESVELLNGSDTWGSRFYKISQMFKNIRYLFSKTNNLETELNKKLPLKQWGATIGSSSPVSIASTTNMNTWTELQSFTVPESGCYIMTSRVDFASTNTTGQRSVGVSLNDNTVPYARINRHQAVGYDVVSIMSFMNLTAGDVLHQKVNQNSGTNINVYGVINITKISDNLITNP